MDLAPAPPRSAITEPVPRALLALLRRAVLDHAAHEQRRVFPPTVHVGVPGLVQATLELGDQRLDHALRTDAIEAMVRRARRPGPAPLVWLTRRGELDVQDVDLAWLAATRSAAGELDVVLPMVVVNRRCWREPSTGVGRTWTRLRPGGQPRRAGHPGG